MTCCRNHWEAENNKKAATIGSLFSGPFGLGDTLFNPIGMPFIVCSVCGNKRCPKATDCALACSGSNAPGQVGSIYGTPIQETKP